MTDPEGFILASTAIGQHPLVPEIDLYLASEITPIWTATEAWLQESGTAPPFWAFAWPGSAAMARHILDHPDLVAGRRVLDFASGGGLAAIACMRAGAACVEASEIDPLARAAIGLNAALAGMRIGVLGDVVGENGRWDLILCGDVCYEAPMTGHILPWLQKMALAAEVWVADPGRMYLPRAGMSEMLRMAVPTLTELEDSGERLVTIWRLQGAG